MIQHRSGLFKPPSLDNIQKDSTGTSTHGSIFLLKPNKRGKTQLQMMNLQYSNSKSSLSALLYLTHSRNTQGNTVAVTAWFIKILLDFTLSPATANRTRKVKLPPKHWWAIPPQRQSSRCAPRSRSSCPLNAHLSLFTSGPHTYRQWTTGNRRK